MVFKPRTKESKKSKTESEVGLTSDKGRPKKQGRVRSRINFGKEKAEKARLSQKPNQLRTREGGKSKTESEAESTSDKGKQKKQDRVRSRINFGQGKAEKARLSPKSD
ncbi:hypothetical protein [Niallia oryzisoli]|uniref:hypothetical protein n=1 Tax=Niallia oryzisoli TaxID=1737571 RepID=UPI00373571DD